MHECLGQRMHSECLGQRMHLRQCRVVSKCADVTVFTSCTLSGVSRPAHQHLRFSAESMTNPREEFQGPIDTPDQVDHPGLTAGTVSPHNVIHWLIMTPKTACDLALPWVTSVVLSSSQGPHPAHSQQRRSSTLSLLFLSLS